MESKTVFLLFFAVVLASGCADSSESSIPEPVDADVYTASEDSQVHKLDGNGTQAWNYTGFEDAVMGVAVGSEGNIYASTVGPSSLQKISSEGEQIWSYSEPEGWIRAVSTDGEDVYIGGDKVFKVNSGGEQVWNYSEHFEPVRGLAVDEEGNVYTASKDAQVHKISGEGEQLWTYEQHSSGVFDVAVGGDGSVYTAAGDGVHKISSEGEQLWTYEGHGGPNVKGVAFHDGLVYTVGDSSQLHVLDAESGERQWTYPHDVWINDVAVDRAGYVYIATNNGEAHKIAPNSEKVWSYDRHSGHVRGIAVNSQG